MKIANGLSEQVKKDIDSLLCEARPKLVAADRGGGSRLFNEVTEEFGPVAHRIYLALDRPERSVERYHDKETRRVLLDPWTVLNRAKDCKGKGIDDQEFWHHGDIIKTFCDYLDLRMMEVTNASTSRTPTL